MNPAEGVSNGLLASVNGSAAGKKSTAVEAQDRFMKLLVTQMKNQDPLNPLDNAQVTSQLAQLSTVTGIDKVNTTLEALMGSFQSGQSLQAANMIGRGVLVPGAAVTLSGSQAVLGVELAEPADKLSVTIRDSAGTAVRTLELGGRDAGVMPLVWDGKTDSGDTAADGKYQFDVAATRGGQKTSAAGLMFAEVSSVSTSTSAGQGTRLNLAGAGNVSLAEVRQIL
jgi:flagellar basal-body rod modification protein FlgD